MKLMNSNKINECFITNQMIRDFVNNNASR